MSTSRFNLTHLIGTDLSSRHRAAVLRGELIQATGSSRGPVVVDFNGVRTVSDSFADELFAVLVEEQGEDWFRQNVSVENVSEPIRATILQTIQDRLELNQQSAG